MTGKIALYNGQNIEFSNDIVCIISFKNFSFLENKRTKILVDKNRNYLRTYLNFKESPDIWQFLFQKYFKNPEKNREEIKMVALLGLKYREHKLYHRSLRCYISFKELIKEVSALIEAYYRYYSIACAILTALFFTRIGLTNSLPKILDQIYGHDFLDDFFFAPAFIFTVFESTTDLLLGESPEDEIFIAKSFLSFLLWRHAKSLLKFPYYKLIDAGAKREHICITL